MGKRFGDVVVLDGVDAHFADGTFVVLVGRSGCGKSTLLRCIAGLEEVSDGAIELGGRDVTHTEVRDRDVAMVFQSYALYPHMTVRRNLAFGLELRKESPAVIEARVAEVARTLELESLLDRFPKALSGGQRQRVAMGRAIVRRPALFMFDEPLSNLDPALRNQVRVDIRRLHDELGATSIYVTHDQVEAMTLADMLVVLDKGKVQQIAPPVEVYRRPANRFVAGFVGSPGMSFVDARVSRVDGRPSLALGTRTTIAVPDELANAVPADGQAIVVGIRPHDVRRDGDGPLRLRVEVVERLGAHVHVHGRIDAGEGKPVPFVAAFEGDLDERRGDVIPLVVETLHLFDAGTGVALR